MEPGDRQREQSLRQAVLRGDAAAWRALYESHFEGLYRYVHFRCRRDVDRTEEVVQECWTVAVRRMRDFDPARGSFQQWLQGIALHVLRNLGRRWQRDAERQAPASAVDEAVAGGSPQPELAEQIALAFTELPVHYQAVLRARYQERRSVAEVAALSNQSVKAVESLLSRARAAFRQAYARLGGDEREPS